MSENTNADRECCLNACARCAECTAFLQCVRSGTPIASTQFSPLFIFQRGGACLKQAPPYFFKLLLTASRFFNPHHLTASLFLNFLNLFIRTAFPGFFNLLFRFFWLLCRLSAFSLWVTAFFTESYAVSLARSSRKNGFTPPHTKKKIVKIVRNFIRIFFFLLTFSCLFHTIVVRQTVYRKNSLFRRESLGKS